MFKNKKPPNNEEKDGLRDKPVDLGRRSMILARFPDLYRFQIPAAGRPGDRALSIAHHLREKRSFEFAPLSSGCDVADQDSPFMQRPKRISGTDLLYRPGVRAKKNDIWAMPPPRFLHTVKVVMYTYGMA